jgi:hypothetical protein
MFVAQGLDRLHTDAERSLGRAQAQGLGPDTGPKRRIARRFRYAQIDRPLTDPEPHTVRYERDNPHREDVHAGIADEARHEQVSRAGVQVRGRGHLLQAAGAQHRHARSERYGLDLVMGDIQRRGPEAPVQRRDLGSDLHSQLGIEVGERFVHEEHAGVAHHRAAHRDSLPLTARQRAGHALQEVLQCQEAGRLRDLGAHLGLGQLAHAQGELQIASDAHVRIEGIVLEHHSHIALLRRPRVHDPAIDQDLAGAGRLEAAAMRSTVDLPQPDGPTTTRSSPSGTWSVRSQTARAPPGKPFSILRNSTSAILTQVRKAPPVPNDAGSVILAAA